MQGKEVRGNDRIPTQTLDVYEGIDPAHVIEEFLLTKGEERYQSEIPLKDLEQFALVVYNLKVTPTNSLHVGLRMERMLRRLDWLTSRGQRTVVKTPKDIWQRAKEVNDRYRNLKQEE